MKLKFGGYNNMDYTRRDAERDTEKALNDSFIKKYQAILDFIKEAAQRGETSLSINAVSDEEAWELLNGLSKRGFDIYVFNGFKFINYEELLFYNNKIFEDDYRMIIRWDLEL